MSKGGSTQTVTQKSDPWKPAQGALKDILSQAGQLYGQGSEYAPFSTVVPFSNQTLTALQGIENEATGPNDIASSASGSLRSLLGGNDYLKGTASGDFLNSNPYLDDMFSHAAGQVRDQVNSNFSLAGRSGPNDAHTRVLTEGLGDLATKIYGGNYATERQNMLNAGSTIGQQQLAGLGLSPSINDLNYSNWGKLMGVGQAYEGQAQNQLQDLLARWNYGQSQPWQNLAQYAQLASGIGGQGGIDTKTMPSGTSSTADALSGAAGLAGLGSMLGIFGGGTGAALGAGALAGGAGAAAGSGIASALPLLALSDRNAKTNIEPIDDDEIIAWFKGAPAYTYDYKPGFIGPMAQDVNGSRVIPMPQEIGVLHAVVYALINKVEALERAQ